MDDTRSYDVHVISVHLPIAYLTLVQSKCIAEQQNLRIKFTIIANGPMSQEYEYLYADLVKQDLIQEVFHIHETQHHGGALDAYFELNKPQAPTLIIVDSDTFFMQSDDLLTIKEEVDQTGYTGLRYNPWGLPCEYAHICCLGFRGEDLFPTMKAVGGFQSSHGYWLKGFGNRTWDTGIKISIQLSKSHRFEPTKSSAIHCAQLSRIFFNADKKINFSRHILEERRMNLVEVIEKYDARGLLERYGLPYILDDSQWWKSWNIGNPAMTPNPFIPC